MVLFERKGGGADIGAEVSFIFDNSLLKSNLIYTYILLFCVFTSSLFALSNITQALLDKILELDSARQNCNNPLNSYENPGDLLRGRTLLHPRRASLIMPCNEPTKNKIK